MQLSFEYSQKIADGGLPAAFHSPDNVVQVFYTDGDGRMWAVRADTPEGAFENREFVGEVMAVADEGIGYLSTAYLPRMNFWAVWRAGGRHRKAVFILKQETNKYLVRGEIMIRQERPIATLTLELENPQGILALEDATDAANIPPGARVNVYFSAGESTRVQLGVFYIDRIKKIVGERTIQLEARNASGKLLRDQSFDGDNVFSPDLLYAVIGQILDDAGVINYFVEITGDTAGMEFPPDMNYLDGLNEIIKVKSDWIIREKSSGTIVIGSPGYVQFSPSGTYSFTRNKDCFSREILREDRENYSRVCVYTRGYEVTVFEDVDFLKGWNLARKKTLYVEAPEDSTQADCQTLAAGIADRLAQVGIIETFIGPFRPQLQPGDAAEITEPGKVARTLGTITRVNHRFGRDGFFTEFSVDSGGLLGKPTIAEYVEKITRRHTIRRAKRLYE